MAEFSGIKKSALAGLVIIIPFGAIIYILNWFYSFTVNLIYPFVSSLSAITGLNELVTTIVSAGTIITLVVLIGYFVRSYVGKIVESKIDKLLAEIPIIGRIYSIVKTTSRDVFEQEKLNDPVKVKTGNIRRTAFNTGKKTDDGRQILFMPTSPNITSGFVIEVKPENIVKTGETSTEALERMISAGFAREN